MFYNSYISSHVQQFYNYEFYVQCCSPKFHLLSTSANNYPSAYEILLNG